MWTMRMTTKMKIVINKFTHMHRERLQESPKHLNSRYSGTELQGYYFLKLFSQRGY